MYLHVAIAAAAVITLRLTWSLSLTDSAAERSYHAADRQTVPRRSTEDHDDLYDRGAQPRRGRQADHAEGGELAGVHVAVAAATSLGRQGTGLLRQHLRRAVQIFARVPRQHATTSHHPAHRQVRPTVIGATENAGLENAIRAKLQGWKVQEWKIREQIAGVENAGVENAIADCKGGKCMSRPYG